MANAKPLKCIGICLRGDDLDPNHVSQTLGIQPSRSQKKGGFKSGSKKFMATIGTWIWEVKSESRPISDMIDEVLLKIGNQPTKLDQIEGVEDAHLDIFFALDNDDKTESVEFTLTKNQIAKASQVGLSVYITVM